MTRHGESKVLKMRKNIYLANLLADGI